MDKETQALLDIIRRFPGRSIAIWGDLILDAYLFGTTRRISREAPVLILRYASSEFSLGGAGNAVLNLWALGARPVPVGLVGQDESGERILDFFRSRKIPLSGVIVRKSFQTPVKTRILAGEENTRKQQILRIDRESEAPRTPEFKRLLKTRLLRAASASQAVLISDYSYQTVQEDIFRAVHPQLLKARRTISLDSRVRLLRFPGVTVATPNEPEVEAALHIEIRNDKGILEKAGKTLLSKLGSPALLITRGSRGMALFERGQKPFHIPISGPADIVDVAGAGDTVISVFTLALACGASFRQAARLANFAGGVVVMKKGTATLSAEELREALVSS